TRLAAARELADVDGAFVTALQRVEVLVEAMLEAERLAEVASRALGNQADARGVGLRAVGAALRVHEAVRDLVERAVASDGDDERMAGDRAFSREIDAVPGPLRHRHFDRPEG